MDGTVKSQLAIQSAKAAHLILRLKGSSNRHRRLTFQNKDETVLEEEILKKEKEIEDLKMKLVMERRKNKRVKLCGSLMQLLLPLILNYYVKSVVEGM
ncbi:uncharacterized protein LOC133831635 isoform X2 [Humulus lupulus]|uniref:uncharacterized protein LOC133831635 isoform X2 n=1 Tax=Humulus lupulus TaxID=3486 RepID=UPI002B41829C|nr:uncharacterized protein LOC133831635 isoform X2 [Humulus lupulus]